MPHFLDELGADFDLNPVSNLMFVQKKAESFFFGTGATDVKMNKPFQVGKVMCQRIEVNINTGYFATL